MPDARAMNDKIIKTKRALFGFYIPNIFGVIAFLFLGFVLIRMLIDVISQGPIITKQFLLFILGPACIFLGLYTPFRYFKNAPSIIVNNREIKFNQETFSWDEVDKVILTGKQPFKMYFLNFPLEGMMVQFRNGTVKYVYDKMYSNLWKVKSFIYEVVVNKNQVKIAEQKKVVFEDEEIYDIFKGDQLTSLRGLSLWGFFIFFSYLMITGKSHPLIMYGFLGVFFIMWFGLNSYFMHYFGLSDKYLVVRNHNFIWLNKIYRLEDISEIVFETQGKWPNCLRVITKDFQSKLYPAGTLRNSTWLDLRDKLQLKGISVRNECI
jgi:hypothetical protein